jgi:hypothetical protein
MQQLIGAMRDHKIIGTGEGETFVKVVDDDGRTYTITNVENHRDGVIIVLNRGK